MIGNVLIPNAGAYWTDSGAGATFDALVGVDEQLIILVGAVNAINWAYRLTLFGFHANARFANDVGHSGLVLLRAVVQGSPLLFRCRLVRFHYNHNRTTGSHQRYECGFASGLR